MGIKHYLKQVFVLSERIEANKAKLEELRDVAEMETSKPIVANPVMGGKLKSESGGAVVALLDLESKIRDDIVDLFELQAEIRARVYGLRLRDQRVVMQRRYLLLQQWSEIASDMEVDRQWVYRVHGRALQNMAEC